ncbi:MAG: VOC family protein [Gemmatimonadota bacterium]|nr:VOC family protein [Candidatus Palauibacterales bacterium]
MNSDVMIFVRDVEKSSAWYQNLFGASSAHGGSEFDLIVDGDRLLVMLHHRDADEHPAVSDPTEGTLGSGVLIYITVDDVDAVHRRAVDMEANVLDEPHINERARQIEFSLRDPDGYALTVCRPRSAK